MQLAKRRADLGFYWNLGLLLLIPIVIYVGSFYGLIGIALSLLGLQIFLNVPNWYFMAYYFMVYYFIPVNDLYIRALIFLSI